MELNFICGEKCHQPCTIVPLAESEADPALESHHTDSVLTSNFVSESRLFYRYLASALPGRRRKSVPMMIINDMQHQKH